MKKIPDNQITFYQSPDGSVNIEVLFTEENIWLTQKRMAELFNTTPQNITQHLKNIYKEGEARQIATCKEFLQVQQEGKREVTRNVEFYNLDAILSVGYRVNSSQATQFRIWATERLKEYIIKGFTMDDERLKNPNNIFGKDYFEGRFDACCNLMKEYTTGHQSNGQRI